MSAHVMQPNWIRRRRKRRAWQQKRREFVYLDEVSVTSLVAAREGSVPESFKDTLSATTTSEVGSSFGIPSTPASPSLGLSSRLSAAQTTAQEVVRRAVVQGLFRGLRIGDDDLKLSVEDQPPRKRPKPATTSAELAGRIDLLERQRRAVRGRDLNRGDVVEVRIDLSADRIYQITATITSILDLVKGHAASFGIAEPQVAEVEMVSELLRRLLVDLVPLTARVTSHRQVTVDGQPWLVDATLIAPQSPLDTEAKAVSVAGVTELPLYWKDVRRVLFEGSSYTAYVRLAKPGLRTSWSPVKLADIFERFFPDIGSQMRELPLFFSAAQRGEQPREAASVPATLCDEGLVPFGQQLAALTQRSVDGTALERIAFDASQRVQSLEDLEDVGAVRAAFEEVVQFVQGGDPIDREIVRSLREVNQSVARLRVALNQASQTEVEPQMGESEPLMEVEFVAIYW